MCRTEEHDIAQWQGELQARSAQVQGELTDIAAQHQGLRQRLTLLEAGGRHAGAVPQQDCESQQHTGHLAQVGPTSCVSSDSMCEVVRQHCSCLCMNIS